MNVYGQIITGTDVRSAVRSTIEKWIEAYLAEIGAQHGRERDDLPPFRSYRATPRGFQHWPEDQVPACIIVSPGPASNSIEKHRNLYGAEWPIGVGVLCSSLDQDSTNELVELYVGALRALLIQNASLGGFASDTHWIDEDYTELTFDESRTLAGGTVNIGVRVDAVLDSSAGLVVPPLDPISDPGPVPVVEVAESVVSGTVGTFDEEIDI